jgi:hypothetical protein
MILVNRHYYGVPAPSFELLEIIESVQDDLFARFLYLASQEDLVQYCVDLRYQPWALESIACGPKTWASRPTATYFVKGEYQV